MICQTRLYVHFDELCDRCCVEKGYHTMMLNQKKKKIEIEFLVVDIVDIERGIGVRGFARIISDIFKI